MNTQCGLGGNCKSDCNRHCRRHMGQRFHMCFRQLLKSIRSGNYIDSRHQCSYTSRCNYGFHSSTRRNRCKFSCRCPKQVLRDTCRGNCETEVKKNVKRFFSFSFQFDRTSFRYFRKYVSKASQFHIRQRPDMIANHRSIAFLRDRSS